MAAPLTPTLESYVHYNSLIMYNAHSLLYYSYVVNKTAGVQWLLISEQSGCNGYVSVNSQGAMPIISTTLHKTVGVIYKRNIAMTKLLFVLDVNQTIYLSNQIKSNIIF